MEGSKASLGNLGIIGVLVEALCFKGCQAGWGSALRLGPGRVPADRRSPVPGLAAGRGRFLPVGSYAAVSLGKTVFLFLGVFAHSLVSR